MQLQLVLGAEADLEEKLVDVIPLVSSELDDLSVLWVLDHRPIAGKPLVYISTHTEHTDSGEHLLGACTAISLSVQKSKRSGSVTHVIKCLSKI